MAVVIESIQRGTTVVAGSSVPVPIDTVDLSRSVLFFTMTGADHPQTGPMWGVLGAASITFTPDPSGRNDARQVSWEVVQFESGVSVQHAVMNAAASPTDTLATPVDITRSCIVQGGWATASNNYAGSRIGAIRFVDGNTVELWRDGQSANSSDTARPYQVVEFEPGAAVVQRGQNTIPNGSPFTDVTISAVSGNALAMVSAIRTPTNVSTRFTTSEDSARAEFVNATTMRLWRGGTNGASVQWYEVVDLVGAVSVETLLADFSDTDTDITVNNAAVPLGSGFVWPQTYCAMANSIGECPANILGDSAMEVSAVAFERQTDTTVRALRTTNLDDQDNQPVITRNAGALVAFALPGPTLSSMDVDNADITDQSIADVTVQVDDAGGGMAYASVYASGTPDPGHDAVKAGTGAVGGPVSVPVATDSERVNFATPITGLAPTTDYVYYATAETDTAVGAAATLGEAFTTLAPSIRFVIPLVDVETGVPWADGVAINWFKWRDESWVAAPSLGAPDVQGIDATANGGVLSIEAFEAAGQVSIFGLTQRIGGAYADDNFGWEVATAVNTLVDRNGDVRYVAVPLNSDNWIPLDDWLAIRAGAE